MSIKTRLELIRNSSKERISIEWNIIRIKDKISNISDVRNSVIKEDSIKSSDRSDPTADAAIKIVDTYYQELNELKDRLLIMEMAIIEVSNELKAVVKSKQVDAVGAQVLKLFYIEGLSATEIGDIISYSEREVYRIKLKTLKAIA